MPKNNKIIYDLAWGNPYFLLDILQGKYSTFHRSDVGIMSYAPDNGMEELVELTKKVIKNTTGLEYQNVFITNGATQAISSILKYYKKIGYDTVGTTEYGYPYYGEMIENIGLKRDNSMKPGVQIKPIYLIDSPSNPQGKQYLMDVKSPTIWDAVYHNNIYTQDLKTYPRHDIMVASYSKLLGITGARVGFVATNCPIIHQVLANVSLKDVATISIPSQRLVIDILKTVPLDNFMLLGKTALNHNREQFQKIEYLFDYQSVQEVGMFYCAFADKKTIQLLEKCGIGYVDLGNDYIRLSMGQTLSLTRRAVETMLKEDRV